MPRADAENHSIDVAPDADVLAFLKLVVPRAAKVPTAITKNFIHFIYLTIPFLYCIFIIACLARFVKGFFLFFIVNFLTSARASVNYLTIKSVKIVWKIIPDYLLFPKFRDGRRAVFQAP